MPRKTDERQLEALACAQHGEGFHLHHIRIDLIIGAAGDDVGACR